MGIQPCGEIPHQSYVLLESDILASKSNQTSMTTVHASHDNVTAMQRNETRNLSRIFKVVPYKYYNKNEMLFFLKLHKVNQRVYTPKITEETFNSNLN